MKLRSPPYVKPFVVLVLSVLVLVAPASVAIDTIKPAEAAQHAGEEVIVEGVVASVHTTPKGVAFINLGEAYPNQVFTGFISNLNAIGDEAWLNGLKGKTVRIHGRINIYHAKPEIRILSKDQVAVE